MVSNFQVEFGKDATGNRALQTIPVYWGDPSRQASQILRQNSENTLNAVPAMSVYIGGLAYDRQRLQSPTFEFVTAVREKVFNDVTDTFSNVQDQIYTVDRLMPAPYKLTMKLDIWTSNTEQKHQIIEQLAPLFNPALEIQSTDNYLDWTSLSAVELTDVNYTSRSVPAGADESYDIASMTFDLPIWLSLPAKVKRGGVVTQVIANIFDEAGNIDINTYGQGPFTTQRITLMNLRVFFSGNTLTLYKENTNVGADGTVYGPRQRWDNIINYYGKITNGVSQVRLQFPYPDTNGVHEIVGTVALNPADYTQLLYTVDTMTLPANTLTAVNAIIDPYNVEVNSALLNPTAGTRFLVLNPIGNAFINAAGAAVWAGPLGTDLVANANDIIEYNGSYWTVSFDSQRVPSVQYVTNLNTTIQYRWTGKDWVKSYEGMYNSGEWSLVL
jgi:hypothetical protein